MDRSYAAYTSLAAPALPASPATGFPRGGDIGVSPTQAGPYWFHMITESLRNVIVEAGLTPLATDLTLLTQAIRALAEVAAPVFPAGAVVAFGMVSAPDGWLECNGAAVSRTTYAVLFAAIGTTYGIGDGSTTFNLPDTRGEFLRGLDHGRGVDTGRSLGSSQDWSTGAPKTSTANQLNSDGSVNSLLRASNPSVLGFARVSKSGEDVTPNGSDSSSGGNELDYINVSGGDPETRPRNISVMYCIKT